MCLMSKPSGKSIAISPFRKLVGDLLHFSQKIPAVTIERRMNLAALAAARLECTPRPMWTSLILKAYSLVAARRPELRRCYMSCPWARFYEHPKTIASINVSRRVQDEDVVLQILLRAPDKRSVTELDAIVRRYQEAPVEEFSSYRRVTRVSYLPWPVRRFLMWATLNWFGRRRGHNFGTFGITSIAARGAGVLHLIPISPMLHFGLFDEHDCLDMRFTFDHRILDGTPAADALVEVEQVLQGEILDEVKSMARPPILPLPDRHAA